MTITTKGSWENPHDFTTDGNLDTDRYLAARYHFTNDVETEAVINNAGLDTEVFSLLPSLEENDEDDDTDEPEILNADAWINLYQSPSHEKIGRFVKIGSERLYFQGLTLVGIDSEKFSLRFKNGRKQFKSNVSTLVVSAKKVIEFYMNKEKAAEQEKIFRAFFDKDFTSNNYLVKVTATFADGIDHNYATGFAKFAEAQAFVEEVKEFAGDVPTFIAIAGFEKIYYRCDQHGTETYSDGVDPEELNLIDEYAVSKAALNIAVEAEEKAAAANVEASTEKTMAAVTANVERHNMTPAQFDEFIAKLKKQAETTANIEAEEVAGAAIEDSAQMAEQVAPILKHEVDIIKSHGEGTFTFSHAEETDGTLALYFNFEPSCFIITGKEATLVEVYTDGTLTRLEEIIDGNRWTREVVNGEDVVYFNGEFNFLASDKYDAWLAVHGQLPILRIKGLNARFAIGDDEFFKIMAERGACTLDTEESEPANPSEPTTPPATFKVGEVYRADWRKLDDTLSNFKILSRSAKFVTVMPVAFAECDAFDEDKDYVFKAKIRLNERGEFFKYEDMTVSAGEAYQLDDIPQPTVAPFTIERGDKRFTFPAQEEYYEDIQRQIAAIQPTKPQEGLDSLARGAAIDARNFGRQFPRAGQPSFDAPLIDWYRERETRWRLMVEELEATR